MAVVSSPGLTDFEPARSTPETSFECRPDCGACCIAPSISAAIPGMPEGKPANTRCVQLNEQLRCRIFGRPERPATCLAFQPEREFCGESSAQALKILGWLEDCT